MKDPRIDELAGLLARFSMRVGPGERVLIDAYDIPDEMTAALVEAVRAHKGVPFVQVNHAAVSRAWLLNATEAEMALQAKWELARMKDMQAYVAVRGAHNIYESADVPADRAKAWAKALRPVIDRRVNQTKWVVLRWPTPAMAQQARMSTAAFEDFFFRVCTLDYARMVPGMKALKAALEKTDRVDIEGPGVDLHFSVKGIRAIPCGGQYNIPDGEVFTAPVRDSVEGEITFNASTVYQGAAFEKVRLVFRKGKVVEASAQGDERRLNAILDADPGARFLGEFALAFNPHILEPMRDILFDEKIAGSFHLALGNAYADADNGNRSQVHWDLVSIQRPDAGGGEIRFDGKVVRKDGRFVRKDLEKLNPEYLLGKSR